MRNQLDSVEGRIAKLRELQVLVADATEQETIRQCVADVISVLLHDYEEDHSTNLSQFS